MAFTAKDGSRHTNHSTMKAADLKFGSKQPAKAMPGAAGNDDEPYGEENAEQDGPALAAEHGPATDVQVHHDHEAGHHTVHASHPDGHEHDSDHASADEAHKFAAEVAGVGGQAPGGDADAGQGMGE